MIARKHGFLAAVYQITLIDLEEKRKTERTRVLKSGSIRFGDTVVRRMLRCLSPSGVALDVASSADIPDRFSLFIVAQTKIHSCVSFGARNGASTSRSIRRSIRCWESSMTFELITLSMTR